MIRVARCFSRLQSHPIPYFLRRLSNFATASSKDTSQLHKEHEEFMTWLRKKTGHDISSVLSIGSSSYGRSLFASKPIEDGDCMLKIPYSANLTPDKILPEVESLIVDDVETISRLAVVLLAEQTLGKDSEWFPYINSLPRIGHMHNLIFWAPEELNMIRQSPIYYDALNQKSSLAKEFSALMPALKHLPKIFGEIRMENFLHAYTLVVSRAWGTSKGVSLVPFADFFNHDGASEAALLSDDDKEVSEVIAHRNYAAGEEVFIRYGDFPNSTLMLDFGFTLPHNVHDQVQICMDLPVYDSLYKTKLELLHKHSSKPVAKGNCFRSSEFSFIIKEVKTSSRKGKGIPQALRAFARVLSISTCDELTALSIEASQSDGRLARRPLKNMVTEIQAHCMLLSEFCCLIKFREAAVMDLESSNTPSGETQISFRRQMALDLLKGEIRVLKSASAWIVRYIHIWFLEVEVDLSRDTLCPMMMMMHRAMTNRLGRRLWRKLRHL